MTAHVALRSAGLSKSCGAMRSAVVSQNPAVASFEVDVS